MYTIDQLSGLLATTHTKYPRQKLTVTWDDNRWEGARIFNEESIQMQGGTTITGKAMLDEQGNARYVNYYVKDELAQGETLHDFTMPWCRLTANWSWDILEILQNKSDPEGFIDLAKVKEMQANWNLAKLFEAAIWQAPTSATDDLYPRGIPYYIRMIDADETTAGWTGKRIRFRNTSTSLECAGINAETYPQWANWADTYDAVNNALVKKLRDAFIYSEFDAPLGADQFEVRKAAKRRVYCGQDVKSDLFDYLDAKDDMHTTKEVFGRMVVGKGTDMLINGHDVRAIKTLNDQIDPQYGVTTTHPIYCVDFSHFNPICFRGYWMNVTGPVHGGTLQHAVWTMFKDGAHNVWCDSPRQAGFVIHRPILST